MKREISLLLVLILFTGCTAGGTPVDESPAAIAPDEILLTWDVIDGPCRSVSFSLAAVDFGPCGVVAPAAYVSSGHAIQLAEFIATYAPFRADTPAGRVDFRGRGTTVALPAEQRMLAEWARMRADEAESGRAGAAWGLALAWSRQGGIAGFCDDLYIYMDGLVGAGDCRSGAAITSRSSRLNAVELEMLYAFIDRLAPVDLREGDLTIADGMQITLVLAGRGGVPAGDADRQALRDFAAEVYAVHGWQADELAAIDALTTFFALLRDGRYTDATAYFGGSYDRLLEMNPGVSDPAALWRLGCEQNGLQCLGVLGVAAIEMQGGDAFIITVRFINADDSLFQRGPCCGETAGPVQTEFPFTVRLLDGRFVVMDLPPYVP